MFWWLASGNLFIVFYSRLRIQCRRKESSRSLSHLLMSFLLFNPIATFALRHLCWSTNLLLSESRKSLISVCNPIVSGIFLSLLSQQLSSIILPITWSSLRTLWLCFYFFAHRCFVLVLCFRFYTVLLSCVRQSCQHNSIFSYLMQQNLKWIGKTRNEAQELSVNRRE